MTDQNTPLSDQNNDQDQDNRWQAPDQSRFVEPAPAVVVPAQTNTPPDSLPEGLPTIANPVDNAESSIGTQGDQASQAEPMPDYSMSDYRLDALTRAIERYPYTPINYVLRGELYLSLRQMAQAAADFEHALTLAVTTAESELLTWGYLNAALIDRAHNGLREISHWVPPALIGAAQEASAPGVSTPGYENEVPVGLHEE